MVTISRVGVTSTVAWGGAGTPSVTFAGGPSGVAEGDLLIAVVRQRTSWENVAGAEPSPVVVTPSGWVQVESGQASSEGVSQVTRSRLTVLSTIADSGTFPVTFPLNQEGTISSAVRGELIAYRYGARELEVKSSQSVSQEGAGAVTVTPAANLTAPPSPIVQPKMLSVLRHDTASGGTLNVANGASVFHSDSGGDFRVQGVIADGDVTGETIPVPRWNVNSDAATDWVAIHAVILPVVIPRKRAGLHLGLVMGGGGIG